MKNKDGVSNTLTEKFSIERNKKWTGLNIIGFAMISILGIAVIAQGLFEAEFSQATNEFLGWMLVVTVVWGAWVSLLSKIETHWDKKLETIVDKSAYKDGYIYTNSETVDLFYTLSSLISDIAGFIIIAIGIILGLLVAGNLVSGIPPIAIVIGLLFAILIQVSKK